MREASVVLNSSVSEGQCNALLEALLVGTPVVARRNAGNAAVLGEGEDALGELFDDAEGCVAACRRVLSGGSGGGARARAARAQACAAERHGPAREGARWRALVLSAARAGAGGEGGASGAGR